VIAHCQLLLRDCERHCHRRFQGGVSISDPIIAKIKKCKISWAEFGAVAAREPVDANGEPAWGTPGYQRWKDENQVVAAKWGDEFMDMLATTPTTPGGAIAMIDCFLEHEEENFDGVCSALVFSRCLRG
jgi:hypothetical protein